MINVTNNPLPWLTNPNSPKCEKIDDNLILDKDISINRFKLNSARTPSISKNRRK
jgi:hypothetical protein